jgi:hypothetical protein
MVPHSVMPALRRLRHEAPELQASLRHTASSRPAWDVWRDPASKSNCVKETNKKWVVGKKGQLWLWATQSQDGSSTYPMRKCHPPAQARAQIKTPTTSCPVKPNAQGKSPTFTNRTFQHWKARPCILGSEAILLTNMWCQGSIFSCSALQHSRPVPLPSWSS